MSRAISGLLVVGLMASAVPPALAADEVHVSAQDVGSFDLFTPSEVTLGQGDAVVFDFDGPSSHTATDGSGMELYDSGVVHAGGPSFAYTFSGAGAYDFVCTLHPEMSGVARIPVIVRPAETPAGRGASVRWSSTRADEGFVFDVQVRRPGRPWRSWLRGETARRSEYVATKPGTHRFRARLRRSELGAWSRWSPATELEVTA